MPDPITSNRAEAERLLAVAQRCLHAQNFNESRDFAVLAQENDPFLDGSDQILAVADVLMASQTKVSNRTDWYAVLQVNRRSDDLDLIKRQYRRLALLLHPDKNRFPFAESAFRLISEAWKILSDPSRKSVYDSEIEVFSEVAVPVPVPFPVAATKNRQRSRKEEKEATFWTVCPYCYNLYEYPFIYLDCCLKCQKCERAFHGVVISPLPPLVPGKDAYYCSKAFFPINNNSSADPNQGLRKDFPDSVPRTTVPPPQAESAPSPPPPPAAVVDPNVSAVLHTKKRGRPRKYGPS